MASWDTLEIWFRWFQWLCTDSESGMPISVLSISSQWNVVVSDRVERSCIRLLAHPVVPGLMWKTVIFGLEQRRTSLSYKPRIEIGLVKQALI